MCPQIFFKCTPIGFSFPVTSDRGHVSHAHTFSTKGKKGICHYEYNEFPHQSFWWFHVVLCKPRLPLCAYVGSPQNKGIFTNR